METRAMTNPHRDRFYGEHQEAECARCLAVDDGSMLDRCIICDKQPICVECQDLGVRLGLAKRCKVCDEMLCSRHAPYMMSSDVCLWCWLKQQDAAITAIQRAMFPQEGDRP